MPDGETSLARGIHRHRAVFVSRASGLELQRIGVDAVEKWLRNGARAGNAVSLVIADCRLLEAQNPMVAMLPEALRARIGTSRPASPALNISSTGPGRISRGPGRIGKPPERIGTMERIGKLAPWIGAIVTAAAGFLVFCLRAA